MNHRKALLVIVFFLTNLVNVHAQSYDYTATLIPSGGQNVYNFRPNAFNLQDEFVGSVGVSGVGDRAAILAKGNFVTIPMGVPFQSAVATGINANSQVVGQYDLGGPNSIGNNMRVFKWSSSAGISQLGTILNGAYSAQAQELMQLVT